MLIYGDIFSTFWHKDAYAKSEENSQASFTSVLTKGISIKLW